MTSDRIDPTTGRCRLCRHTAEHYLMNEWRCDECRGPCRAPEPPDKGEGTMTLRELLAQNNIDLDRRLESFDIKWSRPPVDGPTVGVARTRLPGPFVDVDIHLTIAARE